jgi:hypothetical protein
MARTHYKAGSNNKDNHNKNICALAVANALGVADKVRYLHTIGDIKRASAHRFSVRSRKSMLCKGTGSVGNMRNSIMSKGDAQLYIVQVEKHVLLLNAEGITVIDTDPRKRDRRKVRGVWGLFPK